MLFFSRFLFNTNSETLEKVILRGAKDVELSANASYDGLAETPYKKIYPGTYE